MTKMTQKDLYQKLYDVAVDTAEALSRKLNILIELKQEKCEDNVPISELIQLQRAALDEALKNNEVTKEILEEDYEQ